MAGFVFAGDEYAASSRYAAGQKVLLLLKAWDLKGVPPEECIRAEKLEKFLTSLRFGMQQLARVYSGDHG